MTARGQEAFSSLLRLIGQLTVGIRHHVGWRSSRAKIYQEDSEDASLLTGAQLAKGFMRLKSSLRALSLEMENYLHFLRASVRCKASLTKHRNSRSAQPRGRH
jgi:hypothetical protein